MLTMNSDSPQYTAGSSIENVSGVTFIIRWMSLTGMSFQSYPQLVGVRVCLGMAESGLAPGIYYLYVLRPL